MDKLVEEYTGNVEEENIAGITLAQDENKHENKCSSCALYIVLFVIIFTINIGIGTFFVYYKYMHHNEKLPLDMIMSIKQNIININRKYQRN